MKIAPHPFHDRRWKLKAK